MNNLGKAAMPGARTAHTIVSKSGWWLKAACGKKIYDEERAWARGDSLPDCKACARVLERA